VKTEKKSRINAMKKREKGGNSGQEKRVRLPPARFPTTNLTKETGKKKPR